MRNWALCTRRTGKQSSEGMANCSMPSPMCLTAQGGYARRDCSADYLACTVDACCQTAQWLRLLIPCHGMTNGVYEGPAAVAPLYHDGAWDGPHTPVPTPGGNHHQKPHSWSHLVPEAFHSRLHRPPAGGAPPGAEAPRVGGCLQQRHVVALLRQVLGGAEAWRETA